MHACIVYNTNLFSAVQNLVIHRFNRRKAVRLVFDRSTWSCFVEKLRGRVVTRSREAIPMNFHDLLELTVVYAESDRVFHALRASPFSVYTMVWRSTLCTLCRARDRSNGRTLYCTSAYVSFYYVMHMQITTLRVIMWKFVSQSCSRYISQACFFYCYNTWKYMIIYVKIYIECIKEKDIVQFCV